MPRPPVSDLVIYPAHHRTITADNDVLRFESRIRITREPCTPKCQHCGLALYPVAVRRWRGILKYCIFRQQSCESVRIVSIECLVEQIDSRSRARLDRRWILFRVHDSEPAACALLWNEPEHADPSCENAPGGSSLSRHRRSRYFSVSKPGSLIPQRNQWIYFCSSSGGNIKSKQSDH